MKTRIACLAVFVMGNTLLTSPLWSAPSSLDFSQSSATIEVYDFVEVTLKVASPDVSNPFTDATLTGSFGMSNSTERISVEGFCDAADGTLFRIRFMPSAPGGYTYTTTYRQGALEKTYHGTFHAENAHRRGPLRVDSTYPWHFLWEGTGEHFFFNGTTAYFLPGWRDERIIDDSIERLHHLKVNRLRVLLAGSTAVSPFIDPIMTGDNFSAMLRPWLAESPDSFERPGIDYSRFNVPYWQKWERMLRFARERDMNISVVFYWETDRDPIRAEAAGSEDERRYFRYAAARLSPFANVTWDLGDDLDSYRDEKWAHEMGTLLVKWDPYRHLATTHPTHPENQDR